MRASYLRLDTVSTVAQSRHTGRTYGASARPPSRQPMIPELHCRQSSAHSSLSRGRLHWSPRKSPRDIFSAFLFLGAAHPVSRCSASLVHFGAGQRGAKKPPHRPLPPCPRGSYP
jgi:hypothetical protein